MAIGAMSIPIEPIRTDDLVSGQPEAGVVALAELGDVEIGVWEMSVGVARDVEVDEVFVVVAGRATVEVEGGPTYSIEAGDVVRLTAGDRTTWTVHETLRKVYVAR